MGYPAWSEKSFTAFKRKKMLVPTCSLSTEKDISPYWRYFRCLWNCFWACLELHCDNNQVLSPSAGPRLTLPLPCYASQCCNPWPSTLCAYPGALQHSSKSSVKLSCRLLGIPVLPSSQLLQIFPLLYSRDDLWEEKYNSKMSNWCSFEAISFTLLVLLIYLVYTNWWQKPIVLLKH